MKLKNIICTVAITVTFIMLLTVSSYASGGYEDEELSSPLTPEGNMSLVDDIESKSESGKQFITVTSKSGNYFYIIIDRSGNGENTVHFLNKVDEADLMDIIGEESTEETEPVCSCTNRCFVGNIDTKCLVCSVQMKECAGIEPETTSEQKEPEEKSSGGNGFILFTILLLIIGGGLVFYFKFYKGTAKKSAIDESDEYIFEEYPEDEEFENDEGNTII